MRMSVIVDASQFELADVNEFDTSLKVLFASFFTKYNLPDHFLHHKQNARDRGALGLDFIQWELEYSDETPIAADDVVSFTHKVCDLHQKLISDARLVLEVNRTIIDLTSETIEYEDFDDVIAAAARERSHTPELGWMF